MPALWTIEDLRVSMGTRACLQLLDEDKDGTEDASIIASMDASIEALIYGYVSRVYSAATIRANPPPLMNLIALGLAEGMAYDRRPELVNAAGASPGARAYDEALSFLKQIGKGDLRLDVDGVPAKPVNVRASFTKVPVTDTPACRTGFVKDGTGAGGF